MVGTNVRDRMNEAIIAKMMASARGRNRYPATPDNWNRGSQTMQMHSVETKVGITIWFAASMIAGFSSKPVARCASMFSIITVASSTRMPTASARPPRVMTLMVCPAQASPMMEQRIESGIVVPTIKVERPEPKNSRTTRSSTPAAITISCTTSLTDARTKVEASFEGFVIFARRLGRCAESGVFLPCTPATTATSRASPALSIFRAAFLGARRPARAELVCGGPPRRTWATSPTVTTAWPCLLDRQCVETYPHLPARRWSRPGNREPRSSDRPPAALIFCCAQSV